MLVLQTLQLIFQNTPRGKRNLMNILKAQHTISNKNLQKTAVSYLIRVVSNFVLLLQYNENINK